MSNWKLLGPSAALPNPVWPVTPFINENADRILIVSLYDTFVTFIFIFAFIYSWVTLYVIDRMSTFNSPQYLSGTTNPVHNYFMTLPPPFPVPPFF